MKEYRANSWEHAWLKLVATKSTWTLPIPTTVRSLQSMLVSLGLPGSLSQRSYAPSLEALSQPKHPWCKKSCGQEFKKRLC